MPAVAEEKKESKAPKRENVWLEMKQKTIPAINKKDSRQQEAESSIVNMLKEIKSLPSFTNADFTSHILDASLLIVMVIKIMVLYM